MDARVSGHRTTKRATGDSEPTRRNRAVSDPDVTQVSLTPLRRPPAADVSEFVSGCVGYGCDVAAMAAHCWV